MIGKLQRVSIREVWKHEALDFTTWLRDNIDILNDVRPARRRIGGDNRTSYEWHLAR